MTNVVAVCFAVFVPSPVHWFTDDVDPPYDYPEIFDLLPDLARQAADKLGCDEGALTAYGTPPRTWTDEFGIPHVGPASVVMVKS